ncbi:MAG TPA: dipeptidase [Syntrophobacteraceae bacterium]|nr:dipeptidase [Syntrophobacteraceae bacterium]HBD07537.1 dipeptidase [Syntrophobacteraceae bacterium]
MIPQTILQAIDANRHRFVEDLLTYLQIPSISTYSSHAGDVRRASEWVFDHLKRLGFQGAIHETGGHPVVLASRCPHADRPTILIYGHYDVQPPEPLEEWVTKPFEPTIREGFVYARGATDQKGQLVTYLKAMDAILAVAEELPINVKMLVEGEEEIGSPNLESFIASHQAELSADTIVVSDGSQFDAHTPAITYGLRGLCYLQIDVQGPRVDLHSGSFGGLVANPIQVLAELLTRLKLPDGTVAIPGFYDDVLALEPWERREMASLAYDEEAVKGYLGVRELVGEPDYTPMERKTARPTLDVNGIWGGFAGEGAKTVIPAKAGAKVSMRLVPNQNAMRICGLFRSFIQSIAPPGIQMNIQSFHSNDPVLVSRDQTSVQAALRAIELGFGKTPVFIREGGSIPVVTLFKRVLGLDTLLLGWGRSDDGAHSPNERFNLDDFQHAIRAAAALMYELAP